MKKVFKRFSALTLACILLFSTFAANVEAKSEYKISSRFLELILNNDVSDIATDDASDCALAQRPYLTPVGSIFGIKIDGEGVEVTAVKDSAQSLKVGDKIIRVNGSLIKTPTDLKDALVSSGQKATLTVKRSGREVVLSISRNSDGGYGISVKDGAQGIGTVTFYDEGTGIFAGLGHGICDPESGECIGFDEAEVVTAKLIGVDKPDGKDPGELKGILTSERCGTLYGNTNCGVFGRLDVAPKTVSTDPIPIAFKNEIKEGSATILSTVRAGDVREYTVEISDIDLKECGSKCFKIKVTDPALLVLSGGIVRGMSGSPIIQDGHLVGAVTHVLLADPTKGYGIFIENMLNAAEQGIQPKAA